MNFFKKAVQAVIPINKVPYRRNIGDTVFFIDNNIIHERVIYEIEARLDIDGDYFYNMTMKYKVDNGLISSWYSHSPYLLFDSEEDIRKFITSDFQPLEPTIKGYVEFKHALGIPCYDMDINSPRKGKIKTLEFKMRKDKIEKFCYLSYENSWYREHENNVLTTREQLATTLRKL